MVNRVLRGRREASRGGMEKVAGAEARVGLGWVAGTEVPAYLGGNGKGKCKSKSKGKSPCRSLRFASQGQERDAAVEMTELG